MPTISAPELTRFAAELLIAGGVPSEEAQPIAGSLVDSNCRGYDSHGVMRIPYYLEQAKKGEVVPGAPFEILRETPSILTVDVHWGLGQIQTQRLTKRLIEKARKVGVGVGTTIRSGHIGRLGEYCEMAAEAGMVSMMGVNNHGAVRRVAPPGGTSPRLSTNPLAFGVPNDDAPLILDFSTSVTSEGKVRVKMIAGELCPDGWLLDADGQPTNDPSIIFADPPGSICPMGGEQAYKGFGLSLIVEILSGALSGGLCAREEPPNQLGNCVFMLVLSPEHFGSVDRFGAEVSALLGFLRACPTREGVDEITLPGDPERCTMAKTSAEGLVFDQGNWEALVELAGKLGVALPKVE